MISAHDRPIHVIAWTRPRHVRALAVAGRLVANHLFWRLHSGPGGSPSSYGARARAGAARHVYLDTAPILWWFTALCALLTLVITRIVVVTAVSYGLSQYALEMVIRVLVLELIPLTAALFVALRCTIPNGAALALMRRDGQFESCARAGTSRC